MIIKFFTVSTVSKTLEVGMEFNLTGYIPFWWLLKYTLE